MTTARRSLSPSLTVRTPGSSRSRLARLLGLNYVATTGIAGHYMFFPAHRGLKEHLEGGQFAHASMLTLPRYTDNGAVVLSNPERTLIQLFPFRHVARLGH